MNRTKMVREFHEKHNFDINRLLESNCPTVTSQLFAAAVIVNTLAQQWRSGQRSKDETMAPYDPRAMRAHLILEEVAELLNGLATCNRVKTADGLADAAYVIEGTALCFGMPLDALFDEVHRSNMTKAPNRGLRLSEKGSTYEPPDIAGVLNANS